MVNFFFVPGTSYPGKGIFLLFEARRFRGFSFNFVFQFIRSKKLGTSFERTWKVFAWMWSQIFAPTSKRAPSEGRKMTFV
jgi:hypothetical protein